MLNIFDDNHNRTFPLAKTVISKLNYLEQCLKSFWPIVKQFEKKSNHYFNEMEC